MNKLPIYLERNRFLLLLAVFLACVILFPVRAVAQLDCASGCLLGDLIATNESIDVGQLRFDGFSASVPVGDPVDPDSILVRPFGARSNAPGLEFYLQNALNPGATSLDVTINYRASTIDNSARIGGAKLGVHLQVPGVPPVAGNLQVFEALPQVNGKDLLEVDSPVVELDFLRKFFGAGGAGDSASFSQQQSVVSVSTIRLTEFDVIRPAFPVVAERFYLFDDAAVDCKTIDPDNLRICFLPPREETRDLPAVQGGDEVSILTENPDTNTFVAHTAVPLDTGSGEIYVGVRTPLTAEQVPRIGPSGNEILTRFSNVNARNQIAVVLTEFEPNILGVIDSILRLIDLDSGDFVDVAMRDEPLQTPQGAFDIFEFLSVELADTGNAIVTTELDTNSPQQTFGTFVLDVSEAFTDGSVTPVEAFTPGRVLQTDRGPFTLPPFIAANPGNAASGSFLLNTFDLSTSDHGLMLVEPGETVKVIGLSGDSVDSGELIRSTGSGTGVNADGDVASIVLLTAAGQDPDNPLTPRRSAFVVADAATGERKVILGEDDPVPGQAQLSLNFLTTVAINERQGVMSFGTRDAQGQFGPPVSLLFSIAGDPLEFDAALFPPGTTLTLPDGSTFEVASGLGTGPRSVGADRLAANVSGADGTDTVLIAPLSQMTPPAITIDSPLDGSVTSASEVRVEGSLGDVINTVTVTVNGRLAIFSGDGFVAVNIPLAEGVNVITAASLDADGNTASTSITVVRDTTPPDLDVVFPADGSTVDQPSVQVVGNVSDANLESVRVVVFDGDGTQVAEVPATVSGGTYFAAVPLAAGENQINVIATDLAGNTTTVFADITRQPVITNTAPTIISVPINSAQVGVLYTYDVEATDLDPGDSLTFSLDASPAGMTIDPVTGLIQWTPANDQLGVDAVVARVSDDGGLFDRQGYTVLVDDVTPPSISIDSPLDGSVTFEFEVDVAGPVDDGSAMVTVGGIPALVIGGRFLVEKVPLIEGTNVITATAVDAAGNSASASITVVRDTTPPDLDVVFPADGSTVDQPSVQVVGNVSDANLESVRVVVFDGDGTQVAEVPATVSFGTWFAAVPLAEGENRINVIATDLAGNTTTVFTNVTFQPPVINVAPTIISVPINSAQAGVLYTYDVEATDPDPGDSPAFSLDEAPAGMTIDPVTGLIQWTPADFQLGVNAVVARVTDDGGLFDTQGYTVLVEDVTPPAIAIDSPPDGRVTSDTEVDIVGTIDDDSATVTVNGIPATVSGGSFLARDVPLAEGDNVITATAVDAAGNTASASITVVRDTIGPNLTLDSPANGATVELPSVQVVGTVIDENLASVRIVVVDKDNTQVAEVAATVSGGTYFATVPIVEGENQITVIASDLAGTFTFIMSTFTGRPAVTNVAPVLAPIGNRSVDEGSPLSFTAAASDDDPGDTLTFSLDTGAPAGAEIDPDTGLFSWTPGEADGPGTFPITVRVSDDGTPVLDDSETINIAVVEVNDAPVLAPIGNQTVVEGSPLSFTAAASDDDVPADSLTFSLDTGAPAGADIDADSGVFTWIPGEADGPGTFPVTVRVSDDGTPVLDDTETFRIAVVEVNQAPVLTPIGNRTVDEGSALTFTATASDDDVPANSLTFSLDAGAPAGAIIDADSGVFTWIPGEADGPGTFPVTVRVSDDGTPVLDDTETFTIAVVEVNEAPVLTPIGDQTVTEGNTLSFTAAASDDDVPANSLTFSLDAGAPAGAIIDADSGLFSWTPGEADGGTAPTVTVRVTDDGTPALDDSETISITVIEVPVGPRPGDGDGDGDIDRVDIGLILAARNTPAEDDDPRDLDGDGVITVIDARRAVLLCDRPGCATE